MPVSYQKVDIKFNASIRPQRTNSNREKVHMDKDILDGFKEEANQILKELDKVIESLELPHKDFPSQLLSEFSQKIDRIMGAAKTLGLEDPHHMGLKRISQISQICKALGYRAAEVKVLSLIPI